MNICFESHFPDDLLEKYALGTASNLDCAPLEEHLLLCVDCQTRLAEIEEFILIVQAALVELEARPDGRFSAQSALAL